MFVLHTVHYIVTTTVCLSFYTDTCLKKCKDDVMLFETIQTFKTGELMNCICECFS